MRKLFLVVLLCLGPAQVMAQSARTTNPTTSLTVEANHAADPALRISMMALVGTLTTAAASIPYLYLWASDPYESVMGGAALQGVFQPLIGFSLMPTLVGRTGWALGGQHHFTGQTTLGALYGFGLQLLVVVPTMFVLGNDEGIADTNFQFSNPAYPLIFGLSPLIPMIAAIIGYETANGAHRTPERESDQSQIEWTPTFSPLVRNGEMDGVMLGVQGSF